MNAVFNVPAIESVDGIEEAIRKFSGNAGFEESDQYFIGLAAREVIVNAIKHGNAFDPAKKTEVRLVQGNDFLMIEVLDEGAGFLLENVPNPLHEENLNRRSGRGLAMAKSFMDEVSVEQLQHTGTLVRLLKRLPPQVESNATR